MTGLLSSNWRQQSSVTTGDTHSHYAREYGLRCHIQNPSLSSYRSQIFWAFKPISHLGLTLIQQYAVLIKQYDENKGCCAQIWRRSTRLKRVSSLLCRIPQNLYLLRYTGNSKRKMTIQHFQNISQQAQPPPLAAQKNILTSTSLPDRTAKFTVTQFNPNRYLLHQEVK